ncbi:MAG: Ig-like domain-containing protein [Myxococcaceae bacterium]
MTFTVDTAAPAAPVVVAPANGSSISDTTPDITGTAEANSTVAVYDDGSLAGTTTATGAGTFTFTAPLTLSDGSHTARATSTDATGNVSADSNTNTFTVDTAAPAAPLVLTPVDGASTSPLPIVSGTAEANSTVTVLLDGAAAGTVTADASGAWSFTALVPLTDGPHTASATAQDAAGNTSGSSNTNTFTVLSAVPAAPVLTSPAEGSATSDTTPTLGGTAEAFSTVTVTVDGQVVCTTTATAAGTFSCAPATALSPGVHLATAAASNVMGSSPESAPVQFRIDSAAPLTPVVVGPADGSHTGPTPTVTGTGEPGSTVTVRVDGSSIGTTVILGDGTWALAVPSSLTAGAHTAAATAVDAAGNTSLPSNTNTFTVDTGPGAPVVTGPADNSFISTASPALSGTAPAGSEVTVRVDGIVACLATADSAGAFSCSPAAPLADGPHTVDATVPDGAGGTLPSNTNTFTVDTALPAAPVVLIPVNGSTTTDTTPVISGTAEPFSTVAVIIDGAQVGTTFADATGSWALTVPSALSLGAHTASARSTDRAGNDSPLSAVTDFTVAATGSAAVVLTPPDSSLTNDATPPLSGTATAGATVEARVDGAIVCTALAGASGAWSCTPATALSEGTHVATATLAGFSGTSNANAFTVDTLAPAAPVVQSPAAGGTAGATPTVSGTAEANATITVFIDGAPVCVTSADSQGRWSCTPGTPLLVGAHTVSAAATDAAGNTSAQSSPNSFTVDPTPPAPPVLATPADGSSTSQTRPLFQGTSVAGATVTVSVDGQPVCEALADSAGAFGCTPAVALTVGVHSALATARDGAGNLSAPSNTNTFTVDTSSPAAPVVLAPADGSRTNSTTPAVTGTAEANSTVSIYLDGALAGTASADGSGSFSFTPTVALAPGAHTVSATCADAAGNTSGASATSTFTVDTAAPQAPVVTSPADGASTGALPVITGTAEAGSTVTVTLDGTVAGTATADSSGAWTFTPGAALSGGSHTVSATASDEAGNTSAPSATNTFTVVLTPPPAPVLTSPSAGSSTQDTTPAFSGTAAAGATVTVSVDGQVVCTTTATSAGVFSCTPSASLAEGAHVATAAASNLAGSSAESAPVQFRIDTTPPLTPTVVGPADGSRTGATPTVTGTAEPGSTVTVLIDGASIGTTTVQGDGTWSLVVPAALSSGAHAVFATATDEAGNASLPSNTNTFTVDLAAGAPVVSAPADNSFVSTATPLIQGTAPAGSTVTVTIDGVVACVATATSAGAFSCTPAAPLAEGSHAVTATIPDGGGGTRSSNTNTFTVDLAAPGAPVVVAPANGSTTTDTTPAISGTAEPYTTVLVFIDGAQVGTATADAGGAWSLDAPTALTPGAHTASAQARDRAGNLSASSAVNSFTVGSAGGVPVVLTPPDGSLTSDPTPVISGTAAPGDTIEARVDGTVVCTATASPTGAWSCTPAGPLSEGAHSATANVAGVSATSNANAFTVDSAAPAAPVVERPANGSRTDATPTVSGTAEANSRVTVSIDGTPVCVTAADAQGNWSCTPGTPLSAGSHTVSATATDAAGNTSPPSTPNTFTVDTTAPAAPVLSAPADGSSTDQSRPSFSGTAEPHSQVTVFVDAQPVCTALADDLGSFACTPAVALTVGLHSAQAVARDEAGNSSPPSNTNGFTITPGAPTIVTPASGSLTNDDTPTFSGTAPPGSTVAVSEGTNLLCTAVADAMGAWSCTPAQALSDGAHQVTATATVNAATSPASAPTSFTIDTLPPQVTIGGGPGDQTPETTATFDVTSNEPNVSFECSLDGAAFVPCPSPAEFSDLAQGPHALEVRGTDAAGNSATARREWLVTATPPPVGAFAGGGCGCGSAEGGALSLLALVLGVLGRRRRRTQ